MPSGSLPQRRQAGAVAGGAIAQFLRLGGLAQLIGNLGQRVAVGDVHAHQAHVGKLQQVRLRVVAAPSYMGLLSRPDS